MGPVLGSLLIGLAAAAAFGETASTTLPGSDACVQATGGVGEVAAKVDGGVQLFRARASGFSAGPIVPTRAPIGCPVVRARASGAGVIAAYGDDAVSVTLRDPGGGWAVPLTIPVTARHDLQDVTAAVSERGDVVVAWLEHSQDDRSYRVQAARRQAGGAFGAPELLATTPRAAERIEVGIADSGEAVVLLASSLTDRPPVRVAVQVAIGSPGASFAAPVTVGEMPWRSRPALAVAADGRALVALTNGPFVLAAERPPGGAFGAPVAVGATDDLVGVVTSAAVDANGAAAVAWRGVLQSGARMATRRGPGAFTPAVTALRADPIPGFVDRFYFSEWAAAYGGAVPDRSTDTLALSGGRALFSWVRARGSDAKSASLATLPLGGTEAETYTRGGAITQVEDTAPVVLDDGTAALAYNARLEDLPRSSLHLAFAGARGQVVAPVPEARIGAPHPRTVGPETPLSISVRCARACDARAVVVGEGNAQGGDADRGGSKFYLGLVPGYATWQAGRLRIRVTYGAPGSDQVRAKVVTVGRRRVSPTRITQLSARRDGGTIRVRWRATRTPVETLFWVTGSATRAGEPLTAVPLGAVAGRSFRAGIAGAGVRWVTVRMRSSAGYARTTVRVQGPDRR